jgi:hypothetical protein
MAAIVAPAGDRSMEMIRTFLDSAAALFVEVGPVTFGGAVGFNVTADFRNFGFIRWLFGLGMEILRLVDNGLAPHHRSPTLANKPAGQDLRAKPSPRTTTVLLQSLRKASRFRIIFLLFSSP